MSTPTYHILTVQAGDQWTAAALIDPDTGIVSAVADHPVKAALALADQQGWFVADNDYDPENLFRARPKSGVR